MYVMLALDGIMSLGTLELSRYASFAIAVP